MTNTMSLEEQVLSCVLKDGNTFYEIRDLIDMVGGHKIFWWKPYGMIYKAFSDIANNDLYIDRVSLINHLERTDLLEKIIRLQDSGKDVIEYLCSLDVSIEHIETYAYQLIESNALTKLGDLADKIKGAVEKGKPTAEILADIDFQSSNIMGQSGVKTSSFSNLSDVVNKNIIQVQEAMKGNTIYTPTYLESINNFIGGAVKGRLCMICAYSNDGKSALLADIAHHWAMKNVKIGFITMEMSASEVVNRFVQVMTGLDPLRIERGKLEPQEMKLLLSTMKIIEKGNMIIDDTPDLSLPQIRQKIRKMKAEGCEHVIIDQLQNILAPSAMMNKQEFIQYDFMTYRLKAYCREFDIGIWFAHQANRGNGENKEVSLSRVNQGGERACDVVIIITHEKDKDTGEISRSWLHFAKNRQGKKGKINVIFDGSRVLFKDAPENIPPDLTATETWADKQSKKNDSLWKSQGIEQ